MTQALHESVPAATETATGEPPARSAALIYVVSGAVAFLAALAVLRPWSYGPNDIAFRAGDPLWVQAMFVAHGQAGPFGVTEHLAWPGGASPWALPQLGILIGIYAWVTVGVLGLPVAAATTSWVAFAAAGNAVAILYFLRSVTRRFTVLAVTLAVTIGASVWILQRWGTANLALMAVVPLALALLIRPAGPRRPLALALLAGLAAVSPLWWVVVMFMLLPVLWLPALTRRQWAQWRAHALVWGGVTVGLGVQVLLFLVASGSMSDGRRSPWDSVTWGGGTLLDPLQASPLVNALVPRLLEVKTGSGMDTTWGLVTAALAVLAILVLLSRPPALLGSAQGLRVLAGASLAALLFLVTGGLGALQAGFAVLLGTESPARWWSRMLLVIGLVGAAWLVALLTRWQEGRSSAWPQRLSLGIAAIAALSWVGDIVATPALVELQPALQEQPMTDFIEANRSECPVAQLPVQGVPTSRVEYNLLDQQTYRPLAPYVLAPDFYWTAGSYTPGATDAVNTLPVDVTASDLDRLAQQGYCAVVFNTTLAGIATDQDVPLQGRSVEAGKPDFANPAYEVYLLP